jgi:cytochrome c
MNYYRLNQIAMAVLGALLLFFGARTIIKIAQEEHEPEKPGYEVAGTEEKKGGEGKAEGGTDIAALLAGGDAGHGGDVAKKCAICHSFDKGGANLIGPNLYGVLGRKVASHEGYEYSDALKAKGGEWDYAMIDHMIENPNAFAPGTKMALFPGLPDAKERADVILFLREKNDNPRLCLSLRPRGRGAPAEERRRQPQPAPRIEILALIATARSGQGRRYRPARVCHTFDKGGATLIGPNLYGVVGKKIAAHEGVNYTPALKGKEGDWTYENLDLWLTNPQAFAPGTSMAFPGVPDIKKRADIIAYLRSNADSPVPLPEAARAADKGAEAPASPAEAAPEAPAAAEPAAPEAPAAPEPAGEPAAQHRRSGSARPAAEAAPEAPSARNLQAPEAPAAPEPGRKHPQARHRSAKQRPLQPAARKHRGPEPDGHRGTGTGGAGSSAFGDALPRLEAGAPSEPSMGEPPSPSQPQPVYPDGPPPGVE